MNLSKEKWALVPKIRAHWENFPRGKLRSNILVLFKYPRTTTKKIWVVIVVDFFLTDISSQSKYNDYQYVLKFVCVVWKKKRSIFNKLYFDIYFPRELDYKDWGQLAKCTKKSAKVKILHLEQFRFSLRIQDSMATSHSKLKAINPSYHINSLISNCRWILALHFSL